MERKLEQDGAQAAAHAFLARANFCSSPCASGVKADHDLSQGGNLTPLCTGPLF